MKKTMILFLSLCCLLLTACDAVSIGIIGGADGPTAIYMKEKGAYDTEKLFAEKYLDERSFPVLDLHLEREYIAEDRSLLLDDSIENAAELLVYELYRKSVSGLYEEIYPDIAGESLQSALGEEEKQFREGSYLERIFIDELDLIDRDDLEEISFANKQRILETVDALGMQAFTIAETEMTIRHNEKALINAPQVGNGEITRYFLIGQKDNALKICEVYWEGFLRD